jgi:hypothetical protein
VYFVYFLANSLHPFRTGPYSVRSTENEGHSIATATERDIQPAPASLITLTVDDSQSVLSSRGGAIGGGLLVEGVVTEHGPEHVVSPACRGEDGLGVAFAFGALSVVVVLGR